MGKSKFSEPTINKIEANSMKNKVLCAQDIITVKPIFA